MKSYQDLDIYKLSYELALRSHRLSLALPRFELYEEGSQLRRSSKSVVSTIVEGYGRRRYKAEFVKFLVYAHASCDETLVHLALLKDTHEDNKEEIESLIEGYRELGRRLNKFLAFVQSKWNEFP